MGQPQNWRGTLLERFEAKYIPEPNSGCWLWLGARNRNYGLLETRGKLRPAHRISYELFRGPIAKGMVIDHLCRVHGCVNPDHLEPVTTGENIARGNNHYRDKTHCKRGHEFTHVNTLTLSTGSRACRTCARARLNAWKARHG